MEAQLHSLQQSKTSSYGMAQSTMGNSTVMWHSALILGQKVHAFSVKGLLFQAVEGLTLHETLESTCCLHKISTTTLEHLLLSSLSLFYLLIKPHVHFIINLLKEHRSSQYSGGWLLQPSSACPGCSLAHSLLLLANFSFLFLLFLPYSLSDI